MNNGSFGPISHHNLSAVRTAYELSQFFRLPITELEALINTPTYQHFTLEKKKGGRRQIQAPYGLLKRIQRQLNACLQVKYHALKPAYVHGFVINPTNDTKQCNIALNANHHVGKKVLINMDLKDFFSSISAQSVKALFISEHFQLSDEIATALALLCTYKGHLPTGSPCSPVLSNFICLELDAVLQEFCSSRGLIYSRYADDLTFSSDQLIAPTTISELKKLIVAHDFQINEKKWRLRAANRRQVVTGLTVNNQVNVDRRFLKKTRAMLHDLKCNGLNAAAQKHFATSELPADQKQLFLSRLIGYIDFIGQVKGKQDATYLKMKEDFQKIQPVGK
jgi:RNA-directed DNA polymerase